MLYYSFKINSFPVPAHAFLLTTKNFDYKITDKRGNTFEFAFIHHGEIEKTQGKKKYFIRGGDFGDLDHGEWNIINDIDNAVYVSENCPVPIVYCGFEIGEKIMTGINLEKEEANPVRFAYRVVADKVKKEDITRNSWDPITVYCAVLKDTPLYKRSEKMKISFDSEGKVLLSEGGKDCYMIANATDDEVRAVIDELLY